MNDPNTRPRGGLDMDMQVTVDVRTPHQPAPDEVAALIDDLAPLGAAVGTSEAGLSITLTGQDVADDVAAAIAAGVSAVTSAADARGWTITRVEATPYAAA